MHFKFKMLPLKGREVLSPDVQHRYGEVLSLDVQHRYASRLAGNFTPKEEKLRDSVIQFSVTECHYKC